ARIVPPQCARTREPAPYPTAAAQHPLAPTRSGQVAVQASLVAATTTTPPRDVLTAVARSTRPDALPGHLSGTERDDFPSPSATSGVGWLARRSLAAAGPPTLPRSAAAPRSAHRPGQKLGAVPAPRDPCGRPLGACPGQRVVRRVRRRGRARGRERPSLQRRRSRPSAGRF